MKALTLLQPWATLIAVGAKRTETRSWSTSYRGPLAIHAAKRWTHDLVRLAMREPCRSTLADAGFRLCSSLPRGAIVATCVLYDVVPTEEFQGEDFLDGAFGDFRVGRYAWRLRDVVALAEPAPAKGALGLWEWSELDSGKGDTR